MSADITFQSDSKQESVKPESPYLAPGASVGPFLQNGAK